MEEGRADNTDSVRLPDEKKKEEVLLSEGNKLKPSQRPLSTGSSTSDDCHQKSIKIHYMNNSSDTSRSLGPDWNLFSRSSLIYPAFGGTHQTHQRSSSPGSHVVSESYVGAKMAFSSGHSYSSSFQRFHDERYNGPHSGRSNIGNPTQISFGRIHEGSTIQPLPTKADQMDMNSSESLRQNQPWGESSIPQGPTQDTGISSTSNVASVARKIPKRPLKSDSLVKPLKIAKAPRKKMQKEMTVSLIESISNANTVNPGETQGSSNAKPFTEQKGADGIKGVLDTSTREIEASAASAAEPVANAAKRVYKKRKASEVGPSQTDVPSEQKAEKVKRAKTKATTDKKIKAVSGATGKRKNSDAQSEDGEYNAAILRILEASKKSVREPYGELSDFYVEQTMLVEEDDLPASDELDPEGFFSTPILPRPHSDDNERSAWTGYSRPYIARSMLGDRFVLHSYDVDYNASDPDDEDIQEISQLFDFAQASSDWDDRLQRQTIPNSLFLDERDHEGRTVLTRWSTPIVGSGSTYLRYRQGLHTRIQGWNAGPQVVSTLSPHGHQHASWNYSTFYPNHHHVHRHRRQHYSVYSSYGELPQAQRTSTGVGSHYVEGNQSPPFLHRNHTNQFSPIQSQALLHSSGITTLNGSLNSMELSQSMQPTSSCESLLATHRHDYAVETQPQRFKRTSSGRAQEKFLGYFSPLSGSSGNISLHGSGSSSESFGHEKEARTPPSALNVPEGGVSPPLVVSGSIPAEKLTVRTHDLGFALQEPSPITASSNSIFSRRWSTASSSTTYSATDSTL